MPLRRGGDERVLHVGQRHHGQGAADREHGLQLAAGATADDHPPGVQLPGAGQWVTIYAGTSGGQGHTFIEVAGIVLDTVHGTPTAPAGTGPRWQPASEVAYELNSGSFVARHPQGL